MKHYFRLEFVSMPFREIYSYGCLYPKFGNGDLSFGTHLAKRSTGTDYFATMQSIQDHPWVAGYCTGKSI